MPGTALTCHPSPIPFTLGGAKAQPLLATDTHVLMRACPAFDHVVATCPPVLPCLLPPLHLNLPPGPHHQRLHLLRAICFRPQPNRASLTPPGGHDPSKVASDTWQPYTPAARLANLTLLDTKFKVRANEREIQNPQPRHAVTSTLVRYRTPLPLPLKHALATGLPQKTPHTAGLHFVLCRLPFPLCIHYVFPTLRRAIAKGLLQFKLSGHFLYLSNYTVNQISLPCCPPNPLQRAMAKGLLRFKLSEHYWAPVQWATRPEALGGEDFAKQLALAADGAWVRGWGERVRVNQRVQRGW